MPHTEVKYTETLEYLEYEQSVFQLLAEDGETKFIQEAVSSCWCWGDRLRTAVLDTLASLDDYFTERRLGAETFYKISEVFTPADLYRNPQLCEQIRTKLRRRIGRANFYSFGNEARAEKWFGPNCRAILCPPKYK